MRKIAFISNTIPLPEELNGNTVNIINILRELKKRKYSIVFYLFSKNYDRDSAYIESFKKEVDLLVCKKHSTKYLFFLNFLRKKIILDCPAFFCNFNTGFYFSIFRSSRRILYAADSVAYQYSKQTGWFAKMWYWKMFIEEQYLYKKFQNVVFVSPLDLQFANIQGRNGIYIPIGYKPVSDLDRFAYKKEYDVSFSGSYDYYPNVDAFNFFIKAIFPFLIANKPDIRVCFVGRNPTEDMMAICKQYRENIIVTGEVDSIYPYLLKSRVYLSPLRKGSGMKNKLLQAMMAKLPIVCTSETTTGLLDYNKNSVLVSDDPKVLSQNVLKLLLCSDKKLLALGELNYQCFIDSYTWDSIVSNYYEPLLGGFN